jgi:putative transposase
MSRPLRIQFPGAVYHVTCRGNDRKEIFRDDEDRRAFLDLLEESREIYQIVLLAWVLMENHFHLILETPLGNLDQFMRRFNISYTGYFNRKYERAGHLYQGRYKSLLVEKESYLSQQSRYIHLNPIRTKGTEPLPFAEKWDILYSYPWSTLGGYLDERKKVPGVDYSLILEEFGGEGPAGRKAYGKRIREEIKQGLDLSEKIVGGSILGEDAFVEWVKRKYVAGVPDREYSGFRKIRGHKARENIFEVLSKESGQTEAELLTEKGDMRRIVMEFLYRVGGLNGVEIGKIYKVSYSAVSQERRRLLERMKLDPDLKKYFAKLLRKFENL